MKQLLVSFLFLGISFDSFAQPSTGGTQKMDEMVVDQISYENKGEHKGISSSVSIRFSNTMILIPYYTYDPDPKKNIITTFDTIDISGVNTGNTTFTAILNKCRNNTPQRPDIDCDSLKKLCDGDKINIFWGSVFSTLTNFGEQKKSGERVKEIRETNKTASLLITHGWIYDCKAERWRLQLFVQVMKQNGKKESAVSFYDDSFIERCDYKDELDKKKRDRKKR